MKRLISTLAVVALVLVSLSSCAKADADQTAAPNGGGGVSGDFVAVRLFPEIVAETQDIFIGTLSQAEMIRENKDREVTISLTYQLKFRVDEVLRGKLSPGAEKEMTFKLHPGDDTFARSSEDRYLVLMVSDDTYQKYRLFKIEQDGTLTNFFPDYEALIEQVKKEHPEAQDSIVGYSFQRQMRDSCPKTLDEAREAIRAALEKA